jgi:hypothetical protein
VADEEALKSLAEEVIRLGKLELNEETFREFGYSEVRHLPSRGWCGVYRFHVYHRHRLRSRSTSGTPRVSAITTGLKRRKPCGVGTAWATRPGTG